ncbi:MAG: lipoyl synthase [Planctomycetota bacterium]
MTLTKASFPAWMKKAYSFGAEDRVGSILSDLRLNTVCREAGCPNRNECFGAGTATFLILGKTCSRNCRFCDISHGRPLPAEDDEPERVAFAAEQLGLKFVVVTSVTRDDLPDGGAAIFARTIRNLKDVGVEGVEVLTPDFQGNLSALATVLNEKPDVFNHNVETIPRLYPVARPQADYRCSLAVLKAAAKQGFTTKSGIMVGLGELPHEVVQVMADLLHAGVSIMTIGQYLAPSKDHLPVKEFVSPARFDWYRETGLSMGFKAVASGPFVRSSYMAHETWAQSSGRSTL